MTADEYKEAVGVFVAVLVEKQRTYNQEAVAIGNNRINADEDSVQLERLEAIYLAKQDVIDDVLRLVRSYLHDPGEPES